LVMGSYSAQIVADRIELVEYSVEHRVFC